MMLRENVRAKCIFNEVDEYNENDRHLWFNYLYNIRFSCLEVEGTISDFCANRVIGSLKINSQEIKWCMANTTIRKGNSHINAILEEDRTQAIQYGVTYTPSIYINGQQYTGKMKGEPIFRQICQSFNIYKLPEVCDPTYDLQQALGHQVDFEEPETWTHQHLIVICLTIFLFNVLCIWFCVRRRKAKQDRQI